MMYINEHNRSTIKEIISAGPQSCIFPWAVKFVTDTIKTLPPGSSILEMGTFVGGTTRLFAQANPHIIIHTIDIDGFDNPEINPEFGSIEENPMILDMQRIYGLPKITVADLYEIRKMHIEDYPSIISHTGNSRDLKLEPLDLVFVDASHHYENVLADLRYAWDAVKEGGYIFGDDIQHPPLYNALREFCLEVDTPYTIYSKCFKIQKQTMGNREIRNRIEPQYFFDFTADHKS